ncbi:malate synthase A [Paenibacillus sp. PL91]|uniref:malate synthase A n=1 Tax=Paenibacillus sp. PL91 TaxID=2729538 RepID=UPI00145EFE57|nr:malate synthase A [Paenibacillus sp. PL91]MBC9201130.1 malate synthase A [Paenibacillus sp. PL91]
MNEQMELSGLEVRGEIRNAAYGEILTPEALAFVKKLEKHFGPSRSELLMLRQKRQKDIDEGELPDFLEETSEVRNSDWRVTSIPKELQDRRVEITGPAGDRKMVINALNSGAKLYMSDLEDANSPTWSNTIEGQINLRDAVNGTIEYVSPDGKGYALNEAPAILKVRPRGWHMAENHVTINGHPISASLFDFGLFFFHNAEALIRKGSSPYFYLPKIESYLEARLWNDVFTFAQQELGIEQGSIKVTVLIETILAAFEMDEIIYELREHIAGLNCGRWDYIFSYIKKLRNQPDVILPNRIMITMTSPFMRAYSLLAIKTCHKRNIHCIGGMAAQIPIKNNPIAHEVAMEKVRQDKLREVSDGHDGTWVAHPGLVPVAMEVFNTWMPEANQVERQLDQLQVTSENLLEIPVGHITEDGVRMNASVGVQYLEAWLRGLGAVPIHHLMEDVATAEISRAQLWQWIHHPAGILADGRKVTAEMFEEILQEELDKIKNEIGLDLYAERKYGLASSIFKEMTICDTFEDFLTDPGYAYLLSVEL